MRRKTTSPLLWEVEIPDDHVFLDEMLALLERTGPQANPCKEHTIYKPPLLNKPRIHSTAGRVVSAFLFYGALVVALLAALVFKGGQGEVKDLLGYSYFTVMTPSMQSSIPAGSLIITKKTHANQLAVGDVITFYTYDGEATVTHRILEVLHEDGLMFRTKGDDNVSPDPDPIDAKRVIGKVVFNAKVLGKVLLLLQKHIPWVLAIFFLLIGLSFAMQQFLRKDEHPAEKHQGT